MNKNRTQLKKTVKEMDIPKLSLNEFSEIMHKPRADEVLEQTYRPFLAALDASTKSDVDIIRTIIDEYIVDMSQEVAREYQKKILSGEIVIRSMKDLEKMPNFRKRNPDGSISIMNVPDHMQPWLTLEMWLNGISKKM